MITTGSHKKVRTDFKSRYRLDHKIGSGGAGVVFKAHDFLLNRPVAIKRIRDDRLHLDEETQNELLEEAEAICQVQHPNIVSVFDVGRDDKGSFIVMELLDGFDFELLAGDGKLLLEQFRELAIQSLDGLAAAHEMQILHLDLKPANLILVWLPSGRLHIKIVDFGLACIQSQLENISNSNARRSLKGSIYFMSPEQLNGESLDLKSDLYSLGCLFYYSLTGQHPFQGDTSVQVMASHFQAKTQHLSKLRKDLPASVCSWVMSLIARNPSKRPASSLDALDQFLEIIGE